jgi:hypothetical protein
MSGLGWMGYLVEGDGVLTEYPFLSKAIVTLCVVGVGFWHCTVFQVMAAIFGDSHDSYVDGAKIGFWSTMSSIGNIFGFFFSNLMTYQLDCRW